MPPQILSFVGVFRGLCYKFILVGSPFNWNNMEKQNRGLFDSVEDWVMEKRNSRAVIMMEFSSKNKEVLVCGKAGIVKEMIIESMKSDPNMVLAIMDALDEYVGKPETT